MIRFLVAALLLTVICLGAQAATILVPSGQPTIQAAINAANDGDTIEIANGTYNEEFFVPGSSLLSKNNLTIQPAAGATVTIDCPNTRGASPATLGVLGVLYSALGGAGQPDHHGVVIEGDGITLRNLTIRNLSTTGDGVVGEAATVTLLGDNCTIDNCVLEANPDNNAGRALYIFTGTYAALDSVTGNAFTNSGYAAPMTAANLTLSNSILRYGDATFDTVDAARYVVLLFTGTTIIPAVDGSGSITNCEFVGASSGGGLGELDAGNFVFDNCHIHDANDAFDIGGGNWTFNQCVFERSLHNNIVAVESNLAESGSALAQVTFNECTFCGSADDQRLLRVSEGNVAVYNTIFNVTDTVATAAAIQFSPGDFDDAWLLVGGYPASSDLLIDHCDFYNPNGRGILGDNPQDPGEPVGNLEVVDSIFVCATPIILTGVSNGVARNADVTNTDLFTTGAISNPDSGWNVTEANNLNVDPGYVAPGICPDPTDAFEYIITNTSLFTASSTGGPIGSQGPVPAPPFDVDNWELYR